MYIVYMGDFAGTSHLDIIQQVVDDSDRASEFLLRSYERAFNGFVAKLTEKEAEKVAGMHGVVSVFLDKEKQLHTTRSWDFLGFSQHVQRTSVESDIIVGVIDTGIWPEADSFSDEGFGPPPSKWKGVCEAPENFTCNNKIIGARYYHTNETFGGKDIKSPRDSIGHGTHTASIVAGNTVKRASMLGLGMGTARGGVPAARIAVYKVCWQDCLDSNILSAFHDAIVDGVDIISISVGDEFSVSYFNDSVAIGSFHAMKKGIITSQSAGNSGPHRSTIISNAPWLLSVAASTIDRKFLTKVQLGDDQFYEGISINTFDLKNEMYPLIYGGDAPNTTAGFTGESSRYCIEESLDQNLVNGKIVLCDAGDYFGDGAFLAGAVGTMTQHNGSQDYADSFPLPASDVSVEDGSSIFQYINSTSNSTATIFKSNEVKDTFAPRVASFSSRGPNMITHDILKPDLTAPGVDIVAAWSPISPPTRVNGDNRVVQYNIISGTSMSCPHASAVAAYIKSFHPTWSPAAIKSALMTTAFPMSSEFNSDAEFAYGAGHINPVKALNPGLVYDAGEIDYVKFLCGQGYGDKLLKGNINCSEANKATVWDLNYPSFAVSVSGSKLISRTFKRNVTNVGSPVSIYKAQVTAPVGLKVQVSPNILSFTSLDQKLPFELTIEGKIDTSMVSASLVWDDGVFRVRSPIILYNIDNI